MNLTDLKEKISSNLTTASLIFMSYITDNQLLAGVSGYMAIVFSLIVVLGDYKVKQANIRKIDAEIKELSEK